MSYSGLLNTTCTIQKNTPVQDTTNYSMVSSWADYATSVKCRLDQASGGERRDPEDILSRMTHKLFILYRTDLAWKNYRIVIGSNTYVILLVIDGGGHGHHVELALELIQ